MLEEQEIVTAIIAGIVSLVISGVSGVYSVVKNRKRFEELKKELLLKSSISTFLEKKESFLYAYRKFEYELNTINDVNPNDGIKSIQFTIDFFAAYGRDFYLRNKNLLESNKLNELLERITESVNSGNLNNPENYSERREFGQNILSFLSELNDQTLKIV